MAFRANLYPDAGPGRAGMDSIAAGANHHAILILGVNLIFHFFSPFKGTVLCSIFVFLVTDYRLPITVFYW
jgi:hypothetical protein